MSEVATTDDENVVRKSSFSESEKSLINKSNSDLPLEESKPYLDTDTEGHKELKDENMVEEAAETNENQQIGKSKETENKSLPSVEVSQHLGDAPEPQAEKSLSVIEEEKSASSSVSELIEAAEDESEDISIETDFETPQTIKENKDSVDSILTTSANTNTTATTTATTTSEATPSSDQQLHSLSKQNEVLRSRITELVDQLQKAKREIERLRDLLTEYSDESNNPTILKARLAAQSRENEDLKKQIMRESALVAAAATKERKLSSDLASLKGTNDQLSGNLAQKEAEINKLDNKIGDLTTTLKTLSRTSALENGRLALKEPVICHTPVRCSRRNQVSKICVIL